ncbi:MAG: hypothetical protein H7Y10_11110 [Flavobacterium sp.]|nr:hypothetical protein [Flavobacterium sp.]
MKLIKQVLLYFFIVLFLVNCDNKDDILVPEFKLSKADELDSNEYQIYSLILNEKFTASNDLVINQKTSKSVSFTVSFATNYIQPLKTEFPNLDTTIFTTLVESNVLAYNLDNKFTTSTKTITLVSSEELQYLFNSNDVNQGWSDFNKKYPNSNGIIKMSRVGFSSDKSQAIVAVEHYYGSLGADGLLIYLIKEQNNWRIIKTINPWVS